MSAASHVLTIEARTVEGVWWSCGAFLLGDAAELERAIDWFAPVIALRGTAPQSWHVGPVCGPLFPADARDAEALVGIAPIAPVIAQIKEATTRYENTRAEVAWWLALVALERTRDLERHGSHLRAVLWRAEW